MESLAIPIEKVRSFTREDFNRMRDQGILPRHTELLAGVLVDKVAISPKHAYTISRLRNRISQYLPINFCIRQENPISIGNSEPEPDISIVLGSEEDFKDAHPTTAEWAIEVAISSLDQDLSKRKIYAEAKIPHYWILDPENNRILVFSEPNKDGYAKERIYNKQDAIPIPLIEGKEISFEWM